MNSSFIPRIHRGVITSRPTHALGQGVPLSDCRDPISYQSAEAAVCSSFFIDSDRIKAKRRLEGIVWPRQVLMFMLRQFLHWSYPEIARHFAMKDHGTAMHAVRRVRDTLQLEPGSRQSKRAAQAIQLALNPTAAIDRAENCR